MSGLKCDPSALELNEAIAERVRKAGVRDELRRWVAVGVLLIINGADLMIPNRQRMSCYDRIQVRCTYLSLSVWLKERDTLHLSLLKPHRRDVPTGSIQEALP